MSATTYRYNENIQALEIDPEFIAEGVEHAQRQGHEAVRIHELNHRSGTTIDLDLSPLAGRTKIRSVSISDSFKPGRISLDGLYDMPGLRSLAWQDKKIRPELRRLPQLETLLAAWSKGLDGFEALTRCRHLLLTSLTAKDCTPLKGMAALETLRLSGGSFESLRGIESLQAVRSVVLGHCPKLADIGALTSLKSLEKLHVEKCRPLHDFSFLAQAGGLKHLFVSELDSIGFVPALKRLEFLKFWNLKDGDIAPALASASLEQIDFFPDRRHYSHRKAQANAALLAARG